MIRRVFSGRFVVRRGEHGRKVLLIFLPFSFGPSSSSWDSGSGVFSGIVRPKRGAVAKGITYSPSISSEQRLLEMEGFLRVLENTRMIAAINRLKGF